MLFIKHTGHAEVLPFIKTYVLTPFMLLMIFCYMQLSKRVNVYKRFNIIMIYFLVVLGGCYFFFIPFLEKVSLDGLADYLTDNFQSMTHLWDVIRYWPLTLIYIHGEAWSAIILGVAFWTLANEISTFKEANRIYSYLAAIGSAAGSIAAGLVMKSEVFGSNYNAGLGICVISTSLMILIFNLMVRTLKKVALEHSIKNKINEPREFEKNPKIKVSIWKSFKILLNSQHLMLIMAIVLAYNIFLSLFEAIWNDQIAQYSKIADQGSIAAVYGDQSLFIGILVLFFGFAASGIKSRGWKFTASITPIIGIAATAIFCLIIYLGKFINFIDESENFVENLYKITIFVGLANLVMIKASKYVLFDSTKEQAYIPLSDEEKIDGKAAIDGVGSRFSKSLGGLILSFPHFGMINLFGSISAAKTPIFIVIIACLLLWIFAVNKLSLSIDKKLEHR